MKRNLSFQPFVIPEMIKIPQYKPRTNAGEDMPQEMGSHWQKGDMPAVRLAEKNSSKKKRNGDHNIPPLVKAGSEKEDQQWQSDHDSGNGVGQVDGCVRGETVKEQKSGQKRDDDDKEYMPPFFQHLDPEIDAQ